MSIKRKFTTILGIGSLLLLLSALFSGAVLGNDDEGSGPPLNLTPFSRVAVIGPVADPVRRVWRGRGGGDGHCDLCSGRKR